jgi:predicted PurR-regulated permease PerM
MDKFTEKILRVAALALVVTFAFLLISGMMYLMVEIWTNLQKLG